MGKLASSLAAAHGCERKLFSRRTYPSVENSAEPFVIGVVAAYPVASVKRIPVD
jgi:hypothetical protein